MKKYPTLTKMMRLINVPLSVMKTRQESNSYALEEILKESVKHKKTNKS